MLKGGLAGYLFLESIFWKGLPRPTCCAFKSNHEIGPRFLVLGTGLSDDFHYENNSLIISAMN